MSFKSWSAAHTASAKIKLDETSKDAPAVDQPPAQPEERPAEVTPKPKS